MFKNIIIGLEDIFALLALSGVLLLYLLIRLIEWIADKVNKRKK